MKITTSSRHNPTLFKEKIKNQNIMNALKMKMELVTQIEGHFKRCLTENRRQKKQIAADNDRQYSKSTQHKQRAVSPAVIMSRQTTGKQFNKLVYSTPSECVTRIEF